MPLAVTSRNMQRFARFITPKTIIAFISDYKVTGDISDKIKPPTFDVEAALQSRLPLLVLAICSHYCVTSTCFSPTKRLFRGAGGPNAGVIIMTELLVDRETYETNAIHIGTQQKECRYGTIYPRGSLRWTLPNRRRNYRQQNPFYLPIP